MFINSGGKVKSEILGTLEVRGLAVRVLKDDPCARRNGAHHERPVQACTLGVDD